MKDKHIQKHEWHYKSHCSLHIMILQLTEKTLTFEKMIVCEHYTHIRKTTNDSSSVSHHLQCHIP